MIKVIRDDKETGYLSNYYLAPITIEGLPYRFSESAYQSLKYKKVKSRNIYRTMAPSTAYLRGQKITPLRQDWEKVKIPLMTQVMFEKFFQNPKLLEKILDTGEEEFEFVNTYHDNFWGVCYCEDCVKKRESGELISQNQEGKCLFEARQLLRERLEHDAEKAHKKAIRSLKEILEPGQNSEDNFGEI